MPVEKVAEVRVARLIHQLSHLPLCLTGGSQNGRSET
jgi:hypothetical protein